MNEYLRSRLISEFKLNESKIDKVKKIMDLCNVPIEISLIITMFRQCKWNFTDVLNEVHIFEEKIECEEPHNCQRLKEINRKRMRENEEEIFYNDDYENNQIEVKRDSDGYHLVEYFIYGDSDQDDNSYTYIEYCPYCGKELFSDVMLDKLIGE